MEEEQEKRRGEDRRGEEERRRGGVEGWRGVCTASRDEVWIPWEDVCTATSKDIEETADQTSSWTHPERRKTKTKT